MTKTDAKLAQLDRLVDSTATDAQTGREIKILAREVARAAIQDLTAAAARVRAGTNTATPEGVKRVKESLAAPGGKQGSLDSNTPSGMKIVSYGDNR